MFVLVTDEVSDKELHIIQQELEKCDERKTFESGKRATLALEDDIDFTESQDVSCSSTCTNGDSVSSEYCDIDVEIGVDGTCSFKNVVHSESSVATDSSVLAQPKSSQSSSPTSSQSPKDITLAKSCGENCDKNTSSTSVIQTTHLNKESGSKPILSIGSLLKDRQSASPVLPPPSKYVALDCEFVGVRNDQSALGRCSIVDFDGKTICDIYAKPCEPITTYRTQWSGIKPQHMRNAIPIDCALSQICDIIQDKIVVGHALDNDFDVLGINHPLNMVRDTSLYAPLKLMLEPPPPVKNNVSLKRLSKELLDRDIQQGRKKGHCSIEDATTAMDLYKLVRQEWETNLYQSGKRKLNGSKRKIDTVGTNGDNIIKFSALRNRGDNQCTSNGSDYSEGKGLNYSTDSDVPVKKRRKNNFYDDIELDTSALLLQDEFWPNMQSFD